MRLRTVSAVAVLVAILVASTVHGVDLHPGDMVVTRVGRVPDFPPAVVRVDPITGVRTVVTLLNARNAPTAIAIDANGDLFVTETFVSLETRKRAAGPGIP